MPAIDERGPFRAAAGSFRFANGTDVAELYFVRTAVTLKVLGHFVPSAADGGLWGGRLPSMLAGSLHRVGRMEGTGLLAGMRPRSADGGPLRRGSVAVCRLRVWGSRLVLPGFEERPRLATPPGGYSCWKHAPALATAPSAAQRLLGRVRSQRIRDVRSQRIRDGCRGTRSLGMTSIGREEAISTDHRSLRPESRRGSGDVEKPPRSPACLIEDAGAEKISRLTTFARNDQ